MTKKLNNKYYVDYWANGTFDFIFDIFGYFWFVCIFVKYNRPNQINNTNANNLNPNKEP